MVFIRRMYMGAWAGIVFLATACTGVQYERPSLVINLRYQDVSPAEYQSALRTTASSDDSDPVTEDELPKTVSRDLSPSDFCYVINATGGGINSILREKKVGCENSFPGFGNLSTAFTWDNPDASLDSGPGSMRFDLIGIKKSFFAGQCPKNISFEQNAQGQTVMVGGESRTVLPRGLDSLAPVVLSKAMLGVVPGKNTLDLLLQRAGERPIGRLYGCQDFKMFPEPNSDAVLRTGMKKMFVKVDCPLDADHVRVDTAYGTQLSDDASCDVRGQAFVKLVQPSADDLLASEYGWYLPALSVNAYRGDDKIGTIPFKLKYARTGRYASLKDESQFNELVIPLSDNDTEFEISSVSNTGVQVYVRNSVSGHGTQIDVSVSQMGQIPLVWNGGDTQTQNLGAFNLDSPFDILKSGFEAHLDDHHHLDVQQCTGSNCSASFKGVSSNRSPSSVNFFDISLGGPSKKLVNLSVDSSNGYDDIVSSVMDLNNQDWRTNSFGAASLKSYAQSQNAFQPRWSGVDLRFVRALDFDAVRDGARSPFKDNLVAGGTMTDPNTGFQRAVLYRSPNAGKNWYRVYVGEIGSQLVDAKPTELTYRYTDTPLVQPGFVLLEKSFPLDGGGEPMGPGELRVLIQDQHGF